MSDALHIDTLVQLLQQTGAPVCDVRVFDQVDSTNQWLLQQCRAGVQLPLVCIAEMQTAGRGRRGKHWHSPSGSNLYMSLGWRFELHVSALGAFSLLMGVAVVRGLKMLGVEHAKLKWPNDVLVDNKKLAGILVETATLKAGGLGVVAGIGLNVCMPAMERERINQVITDMYEVLPEPASAPVTRNQLAAVILGECMRVCEQFPQNTADLLEEYRSEYDVLRQQVVVIEHDNGEQQTAIAVGVEDSGALRVRVYDSHHGHEQLLNAGDVSLRRVS